VAGVGGVAVVIPNFNGEAILPRTLDALAAQTRPPDDVLVVDNGSADGSLAMLAERYPEIRVLPLDRNYGFAGGVNRGVRATDATFVAVLNSDARPRPDWLEQLLTAPRGEDVWCLGSVLVSPEGTVESAADHWSDDGHAFKLFKGRSEDELPAEPYDVFAAPGASPLIRRDVFDELGGYCDRYFLYYEDVDLAYRAILLGYRAIVVPAARVEHDLGASGTRAKVRWHVARNSLWTAVRCIPEPRPKRLVWRVLYELKVKRRPVGMALVEVAGRLAAIAGLPWALRERRQIQGARRADPAAVRARIEIPGPLA
jgi:GT2 family glycosyltransferase